MPVKPTVVILLSDNDEVVGVASNIAPLPELEVQVTRSQRMFDELALGKPFNTGVLNKTP
jgi:hypothetical protein